MVLGSFAGRPPGACWSLLLVSWAGGGHFFYVFDKKDINIIQLFMMQVLYRRTLVPVLLYKYSS
jgi:hypothetical protein